MADLTFKHVGIFCDNTSAVAWAYNDSTFPCIATARLLSFLSICRQHIRQASSLLLMNIAGIPSRAFKNGELFHAKEDIISFFNSTFPLLQELSWKEFKVLEKLVPRVISCLHWEQLQMESLYKLPKVGKGIGCIGQGTASSATHIHSSQASHPANEPSSSQLLPQGFGPALTVAEIKSKFKRSRMRLRPSPRPANWLDNVVPSTKVREHTFFLSSVQLKVFEDRTLQQRYYCKWQYQWRYQKQQGALHISRVTLDSMPLKISQ